MKKADFITEKVLRTIRDAMPEAPDRRVLVALSGGPDSMCLLTALLRLNYQVEAAHCNFHLRGIHSDSDAHFVQQQCKKLNISLHLTHFDTKNEAAQHGESLEMAARRLRYAWFEEVMRNTGIRWLCVAHHLNDNVETALLNLTRGTGIRGLTGMLAQNKHIVRPMLKLTRQDVEAFLKAENIDFVTDHTNTDTRFRRNKIRHEVLPLLRSLNPSVDEAIAKTMQHLSGTAALAEYAAKTLQDRLCHKLPDGMDIDIKGLHTLPLPLEGRLALLQEWLMPFQFSPVLSDIFNCYGKTPGAIFESAEHIATHTAHGISIRRKPQRFSDTPLPHEGMCTLPDGMLLQITRKSIDELGDIPRTAHTACLDADKLTSGLACRSAEAGDRFCPFGMKGSKLLSDFLTDRKRSRIDKLAARVVCHGEDIVWVVGERIDNRYAITPKTTRVLLITIVSPQ